MNEDLKETFTQFMPTFYIKKSFIRISLIKFFDYPKVSLFNEGQGPKSLKSLNNVSKVY